MCPSPDTHIWVEIEPDGPRAHVARFLGMSGGDSNSGDALSGLDAVWREISV